MDGTSKITSLGRPTDPPDAANKAYVDDQKGVTSVYTTSTLPTAVGKTGQIVYVSNEGNMAFSNNATWIRMINSAARWVQDDSRHAGRSMSHLPVLSPRNIGVRVAQYLLDNSRA